MPKLCLSRLYPREFFFWVFKSFKILPGHWHFVENWNWPQNVSISVDSAELSQSSQNTLSLQLVSQEAHINWNSNILPVVSGPPLYGSQVSTSLRRWGGCSHIKEGGTAGQSISDVSIVSRQTDGLTQNFSPFFLFPNWNQGEIDVFLFVSSGPINESHIWRRYTFAKS